MNIRGFEQILANRCLLISVCFEQILTSQCLLISLCFEQILRNQCLGTYKRGAMGYFVNSCFSYFAYRDCNFGPKILS